MTVWGVRPAPRFGFTNVTVFLAGAVTVRAVRGDAGARRPIEDRNVRRDPLLLDEPGEIFRRAVGGVSDEIIRLQAEALFRALQHRPRGPTSACRMARVASTSTTTA